MPLNIHIKLEIERDIKREEKISNVASYNICESTQDPFIVFLSHLDLFSPKVLLSFYFAFRVASADMAIKHAGCEKFVENLLKFQLCFEKKCHQTAFGEKLAENMI